MTTSPLCCPPAHPLPPAPIRAPLKHCTAQHHPSCWFARTHVLHTRTPVLGSQPQESKEGSKCIGAAASRGGGHHTRRCRRRTGRARPVLVRTVVAHGHLLLLQLGAVHVVRRLLSSGEPLAQRHGGACRARVNVRDRHAGAATLASVKALHVPAGGGGGGLCKPASSSVRCRQAHVRRAGQDGPHPSWRARRGCPWALAQRPRLTADPGPSGWRPPPGSCAVRLNCCCPPSATGPNLWRGGSQRVVAAAARPAMGAAPQPPPPRCAAAARR